MNKKVSIIVSSVLLGLFILLVLGVKFIDVNSNSLGSKVGLYSLNSLIKYQENHTIDKISDVLLILGFLAFGFVVVLGIYQLIKNKSLKKVNPSIYVYGGSVVFAAIFYIIFDKLVVNKRPILVDGILEASFPSTHVFIFVSLVLGAVYVASKVFEIKYLKPIAYSISGVLIILMMVFRVMAGMHWITDVLAGLLFGAWIYSLNPLVFSIFQKEKE